MKRTDTAQRQWWPAAALTVVLLLGACGSPGGTPGGTAAGSPGGSPSPTAGVTLVPTPGGSATRGVEAGPIVLAIPAAWNERSAAPNPSGNFTFAFLGPEVLPSECTTTPQGGMCGPWPNLVLPENGLVVRIRGYFNPAWQPPSEGERVDIDSHPAFLVKGPADEGCAAVGGAESISIVFDRIGGQSGWTSLDACLAGPDVATAEAAFFAILPAPPKASVAPTP
jgi:hypothetical protein